jgi:hypothetical protein
LKAAQGAVEALEALNIKLTAPEAFARSVLYGGVTYRAVEERGFSVENLWQPIAGIATTIPKLLFSPKVTSSFWKDLGKYIGLELETSGFVKAVPIIGQVYSVVSAFADTSTLGQCAAETVFCPWVIGNEVALTYPATVTIARDPRSSTFPATARSWRLEALVDGTVGLAPITGEINPGGRLRSDPLVLQVTAPFGGKTIQWSAVFLDEDGLQVGTGDSEQYPNSDSNAPASAVSFAIEQLAVTIDERTVFKRAATTTYSPDAKGYTWSSRVKATGTAESPDAQRVAGSAVATLAGVAGLVWKEKDRYYVRGVPLAQNGETIRLGTASHQGWARRPFLLLDSFVDAQDDGNHVLLEPDENTSGYDVRKVTLDPDTGAITWEANVSLGNFILPVSAAALHSSGQVVAINTDTGRLAVLDPVRTSRPPQAFYAAGPGDQPGLLNSPVALAITNPGVVLVLEAGGSQISAFDLNLNPVRYFGKDHNQFAVDLDADGTYLDLAVDGASQIYALSFKHSGQDPDDYRIDVYTPDGTPLATHSPGTNIPHLAIDYWRSISAANYDPLTTLGTTQPRIDPKLGITEPSLSRFDPTRRK